MRQPQAEADTLFPQLKVAYKKWFEDYKSTLFGLQNRVKGRGEARIVGVISDVRQSTVEEKAEVQVYVPITQVDPKGAELVVRTRLPIAVIEPAVISALRALNPGQPRTQFRAVQGIVDHAVSPRRFLLVLVISFAVFGLLLASLGIHGAISYSVRRRAQEIGIRMAPGASGARIQAGIVKQVLLLTVLGIGIGGAASFTVARMIASLLFGTEPIDPPVFAGTFLLLGVVALLAGQVPAIHASRIDPALVLRNL